MKTARRNFGDVNGLIQRSHVAIIETSLIYQGVWGNGTFCTNNHTSEA